VKASTFLRIAAVITFLFFVGHTAGFPWTPGEAAADQAVVEAMRTDRFPVLGSSRSYWDFYIGFGLIISVLQLAQAIVLWQLGGLAKTDAARLRPIIAVFFAAFISQAVLGWTNFFVIPVVMSTLIAICLAMAFFMTNRGPETSQGGHS
jgi:hypothetical protein